MLRALLGSEEFELRADPNHWVLLSKTDWTPSDYLGGRIGEEEESPFDDMEPDNDSHGEKQPEGFHVADYWDAQIIN